MLTPSLNTVMTRLLIVAAVLGSLVFFAPAIFAQDADDTITYDENGTDPVRTFTSTDPEGAGIDWDVTGLDAEFFSIDSRGMLMFKSPPDFERARDKVRNDIDEVPGTFLGYLDADGEVQTADNANDDALANIPPRDREFAGGDSFYQITIRATERTGTTNRALSTEEHFTVEVTNVEEDGSVSMNWIQPEIGTPITATLDDGDANEAATEWKWYISKVTNPDEGNDTHWTLVETQSVADDEEATETTSTYIPLGDCVDDKGDGNTNNPPIRGCNVGAGVTDAATATARDEDKILRAVATYTDDMGEGNNTARGISERAVRAEVGTDLDNVENPENGSPGFRQGADYTRSISESAGAGSPVGSAVVATDPQNDELTYHLDVDTLSGFDDNNQEPSDDAQEGHAVHNFTIDRATGQIMLANKLDADGNGTYEFYVRATDPSGEAAFVEVTVTATAANDAPVIMGSLMEEQYSADPVPPTPAGATEIRVYEQDDDNDSYTGLPGMPLPTVEDEDGNTVAGLGQPNVFTASDQDIRGQIFWSLTGKDAAQFVRSSTEFENFTGLTGPDEPIAIRFASPPDYENPTDANKDSVYEVTLVARDSAGAEDSRDLTVFVMNVDEAGDVSLSTNQPLIGQEITARVSDPDNHVTVVTWRWERSSTSTGPWTPIPGATTGSYTPWTDNDPDTVDDNSMFLRATATYLDATSMADDRNTGNRDERVQELDEDSNVVAKTATTTDSGSGPSRLYRVSVTSANAVRVDDTSQYSMPVFSESSYEREVNENAETGSIVGVPVQADYNQELKYSIRRADANDNRFFSIDDNGQIRVGRIDNPSPTPSDQYEVPTEAVGLDADSDPATTTDPILDHEGKNSYTLLITAAAADDMGRKATATVTVNVADLNEAPYFDKESRDEVEGVAAGTGIVTTAPIMYAENRRTEVVALAAIEPDGDSLRWELTGADADSFEIEDVADGAGTRDRVKLNFKSQPDYEDRSTPYNVTVRATEMSAVGGGPNMAAELDVIVQVMNVDEKGSIEVKWLQPEVNTALPAILTDPDGPPTGDTEYTVSEWAWYRAKVANPNLTPNLDTLGDSDSEWEGITEGDDAEQTNNPTTGIYTPGGRTAGTTEDKVDEGKYLLVTAVYTDAAGADARTAFGISANPVRDDVSDADNNSPDFRASKTTRTIPEDTAKGEPVGRPVMVDINEDRDTLTYELVRSTMVLGGDAPDDAEDGTTATGMAQDVLDHFEIDKATGQITLKDTLTFENGNDGEYGIGVRATDPSGEPLGENTDDILVTVVASNVNEAPGVRGAAELTVNEIDSSDDDAEFLGLQYRVDPDTGLYWRDDGSGFEAAYDTDDNLQASTTMDNLFHRTEEDFVDFTTWPEPIGGPDGALFEYSVPREAQGIARRLHFKSAPDFENPLDANRDNVYEVTINVIDTAGATGSEDIRITVLNVNEDGKLTLAPAQPHRGSMVEATLTDPDGIVTITDWMWAHATTTEDEFDITTEDGDPVTVELIDDETMRYYIPDSDDIVGKFLWAMVDYRDGASVVDDPVTALDERNDMPNTDTDSEIETMYDSDRKEEATTDRAVQEEADTADPSEFPGRTINLEVAETAPSTGYVGSPVLTYDPAKAENRQDPRVNVGGPDGALFTFAEDHDANNTTATPRIDSFYDTRLSSDLGATPVEEDTLDKFGQLALRPITQLDFEAEKNTYTVEVMDEDATNELGVITVVITVTDMNEAPSSPQQHFGPGAPPNTTPMFDEGATTTRSVAENTAAGTAIGAAVTAMDPDRGAEGELTYSLGGTDGASFDIASTTGQLSTSAPLDFETKSMYMVDVTATDGGDPAESATIMVTINVTDVGLATPYDADEDGIIDATELLQAVRDFFDEKILGPEVLGVVRLYFQNIES